MTPISSIHILKTHVCTDTKEEHTYSLYSFVKLLMKYHKTNFNDHQQAQM